MLRVVHTSDWHLGHQLHDVSREREHDAFLTWLGGALARLEADALVIAGDIFDSANPIPAAQARWYRFLGGLAARTPAPDVLVIGGNHDSAARLDAPHPILDALGVRVVGGLPAPGGALDLDRLVVPLHDRDRRVAAWVAAVPFLRAADLPIVEGDDPLVEGVRAIYDRVVGEARRRRTGRQAVLATGHCYVSGARASEQSERRILGGNQHALPADLFSADLAYVALGHLHLAQEVRGRPNARYCGSPIPLSMGEIDYPHQVCVVDIDGDALVDVRAERVPRTVRLLRVPPGGPAPLDEVLSLLRSLPAADPGDDPALRPLLEVLVRLAAPIPALRGAVEAALEGRDARLLRVGAVCTGDGLALGDRALASEEREVLPEDVFRGIWARSYEGDPPPEMLASFHELVERAAADPAEGGPGAGGAP